MSRRLVAFVCAGLLMSATPALAQMQWTDKGFLGVSGGMQVGAPDVTTSSSFEQYGETATLDNSIDMKAGAFVDVQAGYRVWRNLAIGAGYTFVTGEGDATIDGSIPDPIRFDAPRAVSATASGLGRTEQWFSALLAWGIPVTDKIDVLVSGGPAYVSVSQDFATSGTVTEPGPTLAVATAEQSESGLGFVVGADIRYLLTPRFGLGVTARFATASVDFADADVDVGGFQLGAGLRVRF